jgi:hypothetical protein
MATRENMAFALGETWVIEAALTDADAAALDLTGGTVSFRMGAIEKAATVLDAVAGTTRTTITAADQADIAAGVYPYEIRATLPGPVVTTQVVGDITVQPTLFN